MFIIPAILAAIMCVYVFIPRRGFTGFLISGIVVTGFFAAVWLTKLIILA